MKPRTGVILCIRKGHGNSKNTISWLNTDPRAAMKGRFFERNGVSCQVLLWKRVTKARQQAVALGYLIPAQCYISLI